MEELAYLNGKYVSLEDAKLPVYDASVVLGATVTEMMRTFNKTPHQVVEHSQRLFDSVKYARFNCPWSITDVIEGTRHILENNKQNLDEGQELGIVQFVSAGSMSVYAGSAISNRSMEATVCVHTFKLPIYLWKDMFLEGIHAVTPPTRHIPNQCIDPRMKYRSRLNFFIGDQEAKLVDPKALTLLLDLDGHITEFTGGNIILYKDGKLITPLKKKILEGMSLKTVEALAEELGVDFIEKDLYLYDLIHSEEAFQSGSAYGLLPVTKVNGLKIGDGKPGTIYQKLLDLWGTKLNYNFREAFMKAEAF